MKLNERQLAQALFGSEAIANRAARWWSARDQAAPKINAAIADRVGTDVAAMIRDGANTDGVVTYLEHTLAHRDAALDDAADFIVDAQDRAELRDEVERQMG